MGTSSWTDPTLIKSGRFYPTWAKTAEARLQFYASQFKVVEVDSTCYSMPAERVARLWAERTPAGFISDVKAFRVFTLHPTPSKMLPKDVREGLSDEARQKPNVYLKDMPTEVTHELWRRFNDALLLIDSAGKLGIVMLQFPPWFYPGNEQRDYIISCKEKLRRYRIAVEFRHNSWLNEKNRDRTIAFLRDNDLPLVCVDEPHGFKI